METHFGSEQYRSAIASPVDRRSSPRHDASELRIVAAPCAAGVMPEQGSFKPVRGHDISSGGIAFYWPEEPNCRQMAIGLGGPPAKQFVIAKIVRTARQVDSTEFLVACQFAQPIEVDEELY